MKILIAPWGNPGGWKEVTYVFDGKNMKSKTSLEILQEVIKPDKTIIICLDTLAEEGKNYKEVRENAERRIREYADKFGLSNYEVLTAPGIGTFPNGIFRGDALDYYHYIIAKLNLNFEHSNLDIHLDLTHGINYQTILTYRAIKEMLELFSIFKKTRFKAYNADPSSPTIADKLFINVVEDTIPIPMPSAEKISQGRPLEPVSLSSEEREVLFKNELENIKINNLELSAFIGALYNGLPLALFRFYPEKDKIEEVISTVLNTYEKYVEVKKEDKLKVTRKVKFGKDFKVYVFTYVIATLLKKLKLISSRKKEVALDEIENLKENLFKFDKRFKMRIDDDLYTLKKDLKEREIRNWQIYNEILGKPIGEPNLDARNFLAHSGFERNVVEIKKKKNDILMRYHENKIRVVVDLCQRGLR